MSMRILISAYLSVFLTITSFGPAARAQSEDAIGGVIDYVRLLSPLEKKEIQEISAQVAFRYRSDFFIVTVDDHAPQWKANKSHYLMIEKITADVQRAVKKHYQRMSALTLLIAFKSSVVLHLKTTDKALSQFLLFNQFYGGARQAFKRVRRKSESYADAIKKNVETFVRISREYKGGKHGLALQVERAQSKAYGSYALLATRKLVAYPWLEPFCIGLLPTIYFLANHELIPGWIAFLVIVLLIYVGCLFARNFMSAKFGEIGGCVGKSVLAVLLIPPLCFLFAVTQCDLENILYISQVFGGDLGTYLRWSLAFERSNFQIPWAVFVVAASALAGSAFYSARNELSGLRGLVILSAVVWVMSLVIWPGLVALCFLVISFVYHTWRVYKVQRVEHTDKEGLVLADHKR